VLDERGELRRRINPMMLDQIEPLDEADAIELRDLVAEHERRTGSPVARRVLDGWDALLPRFVKVFPTDYKRVLAELERQEEEAAEARAAAIHRDHPGSTGGEGFVTTESENGDEAIRPDPEEVPADG
jgi:glutamate synthase domain-containing protein 3